MATSESEFLDGLLTEIEANMKTILRISLIFNLALLSSLIFFLTHQRRPASAPAPALPEAGPSAPAAAPAPPATSDTESSSFRWDQLIAAKDYRIYIANLRAIGCPEATIEDIVRGDTDRAFSWERSQLGLDDSGTGPWSQSREMELVASLLGGQPPDGSPTLAHGTRHPRGADDGSEIAQASVPLPDPNTKSPSCPLFLQNRDWSALGFSADQQAVIAQVRHQFQNATANLNQSSGDAANLAPDAGSPDGALTSPNPGDSAALAQWQKALQNADDQLHGLLGAQGYMAYEQQQYYAWYQPQVEAVAASGEPLTINPAAYH